MREYAFLVRYVVFTLVLCFAPSASLSWGKPAPAPAANKPAASRQLPRPVPYAPGRSAAAAANARTVAAKIPSHMTSQQMREQVVQTAFSQLGLGYRFGGVSPQRGFDCSGYTRWVFSMLDIKLPRTSREQFNYGQAVDKANLRPGDLVFFRNRRAIGHVGVYVTNNHFIHSPNRNSEITISDLNGAGWGKSYAGARRIIP
jgi:cell wall-associated NlpC family hydrolase